MRHLLRLAMFALVLSVLLVPGTATADEQDGCDGATDLGETNTGCQLTAQQAIDAVHMGSGTVRYRLMMECLSDSGTALCNNPRACPTPPGSILFDVFRSDDSGGSYRLVATVCLDPDQTRQLDVITIQMVESAFKRLDWPISPVVIEPPNGRTLVNLDTNFLTTNTAATTQSVDLLGHTVEIEATPVSWTWRYGDGVSATTSTPGAAYPDLEVTHAYVEAKVTVHPSVDTTYHGRYRVDGGQWADIPVERTIDGTPVDLQVLSARPVLVDPSG